MLKKMIGFLLVGVVLIGILSGCGKSATQTSGGTTEIVWYSFGKTYPDSEKVFAKMNEIFKEKLGVTVKWEILDVGAYNEKLNLIISSGEQADIAFTSNWINTYVPNVRKGAFEAIDELLGTSATKLKEAVPEYLWKATKVDGKIYGVPNEQVSYIENGMAIQKKLVEKYKLDIGSIKKISDLEEFFLQIKENEPDLIPVQNFTLDNFDFEKVQPTNLVVKNNDTSLTPIFFEETDEYKNYLKLKRDWFNKGILRSDISSVTNDITELAASRYAAHFTTLKEGGAEEIKIKAGTDHVTISLSEPYLNADAGVASMNAILKQSKNKEKALQVLELMNTDKTLYNLKCFGIEGEHYKTEVDGRITRIEGKYDEPNAWQFGNNFNALVQSTQSLDIWKNTKAKNESSIKSLMQGFVFDTESVKNQMSQVNSTRTEFAFFETGCVDIEPKYKEYVAKLKAAGIEDIRKEIDKQLKEWQLTK